MSRRLTWWTPLVAGAWLLAPARAARAAPPPGGDVDAEITRVLADPDFAGLQESLFEQLRERAIAFILDQLGSLFGDSATSTIAVVILVVAVVVMGLVARRLVARRVGPGADDGQGVVVDVRRPAGQWWAEARQARASGDLGEAARLGYRAVVATLDARGLVDDVDGRTVGEHRRRLTQQADAPGTLAGFDDTAGVFERSWYGGQDVDDRDLDAIDDAARRIGVDGA